MWYILDVYKGLIFVVVLLGLAVFSARHQENPRHNQIGPTKPPTEAASTANQAHTANEASQGQGEMQWVYDLIFWPYGITALAVILTLGGIIWQSSETKTAAQAALKQAEHMISSERAWLLISPVNEGQPLKAGNPPLFWWEIKNVGNTPARLIETQSVCDARKEPQRLRETPEFRQPVALNMRMLAPGDTMRFSTFWTEEVEQQRFSYCTTDVVFFDPLFLLAYGYVKYASVFSSDALYSGFCADFCSAQIGVQHAKSVIEFRPKLDAPPEYTKHT